MQEEVQTAIDNLVADLTTILENSAEDEYLNTGDMMETLSAWLAAFYPHTTQNRQEDETADTFFEVRNAITPDYPESLKKEEWFNDYNNPYSHWHY